MPVWNSRPVDEVPTIELTRWSVRELPDGDRHFVGWNSTEGEGRASSKIMNFDPDTMIGVTRSGRQYQLCGDTAVNLDAEYVWTSWCRINRVETWEDVSEEYVELGLKALWKQEGKDPNMFPTLGTITDEDMKWAAEAAERLGRSSETAIPPLPASTPWWAEPCCENEKRNMNGGCDNCGDPCL